MFELPGTESPGDGVRPRRAAVRSVLFRYGCALGLLGVVLAAKAALATTWVGGAPFVLISVVVALSAVVGGLGPGLLTAVLSTAAVEYLFLEPRGPVSVTAGTLPEVGVRLAEGIVLAWIGSAFGRAERLRRQELERAGKELRRSEGRFRTLTEALPQIVWTARPDGSVDFLNGRWTACTGLPTGDCLGWAWRKVLHPDDEGPTVRAWTRAVSAGELFEVEHRVRSSDGAWRWHLSRAIPLPDEAGRITGWFGTSTDIHEHKLAQEDLLRHRERLEEIVQARTAELERSHQQLRLSERMAALGTLSLGLGHDMGNLLLPIRTRLDVLGARPDLPGDVRESLDAMRTCADYLQNLSHGLRLFALDPDDQNAGPDLTDPVSWSREALPFFRNALGRQISFQHDLAPDLPPLAVAPHRLTQAVLNLVTNARDAIGARPDGRVQLRARAAASGRSVRIEVADNGPGMTEEVRRRCLEPFFTTKIRGVSTGLGLALVHGIVHKAGGAVHVESAPGRGTVVTITIPAATDEPAEERPSARAVVSIDDARTRAVVAAVLRTFRIEALEADAPDDRTDLWVLSATAGRLPAAASFLANRRARNVIALGDTHDPGWCGVGARMLRTPMVPAELREQIRGCLAAAAAEPVSRA